MMRTKEKVNADVVVLHVGDNTLTSFYAYAIKVYNDHTMAYLQAKQRLQTAQTQVQNLLDLISPQRHPNAIHTVLQNHYQFAHQVHEDQQHAYRMAKRQLAEAETFKNELELKVRELDQNKKQALLQSIQPAAPLKQPSNATERTDMKRNKKNSTDQDTKVTTNEQSNDKSKKTLKMTPQHATTVSPRFLSRRGNTIRGPFRDHNNGDSLKRPKHVISHCSNILPSTPNIAATSAVAALVAAVQTPLDIVPDDNKPVNSVPTIKPNDEFTNSDVFKRIDTKKRRRQKSLIPRKLKRKRRLQSIGDTSVIERVTASAEQEENMRKLSLTRDKTKEEEYEEASRVKEIMAFELGMA